MLKTTLRIGPQDQGRRMSLREFEPVEVQEGYIYELSRGIISVSEVAALPHALEVSAVRRQLFRYQEDFPGEIYVVLGTTECKLLIGDFESERHPDLAVYKTKPSRKEDLWYHWIPEIVVEVVSTSSAQRDYVEKREEYLALGIKEYWIVDGAKQHITFLRRLRGKWSARVLKEGSIYETKLLPGFRLDYRMIFEAGE